MPPPVSPVVTRFAPSPTGRLHLGHAFSALTADAIARAGGHMLLRIEDLDPSRCRPAFDAGIVEDLAWLGLRWPEPVLRQSAHLPRYANALNRLANLGLTYPCRCTRAEIRAALSAPQEGGPPPLRLPRHLPPPPDVGRHPRRRHPPRPLPRPGAGA